MPTRLDLTPVPARSNARTYRLELSPCRVFVVSTHSCFNLCALCNVSVATSCSFVAYYIKPEHYGTILASFVQSEPYCITSNSTNVMAKPVANAWFPPRFTSPCIIHRSSNHSTYITTNILTIHRHYGTFLWPTLSSSPSLALTSYLTKLYIHIDDAIDYN